WVGMIHTTSIRRKALSLIQRKLIKHLADTLKPNIIHTHTHIYKIKLAEKGIIASLMPLFGNIPVSDKLNQKWLPTNNVKYIAFFGTIHPQTASERFVQELSTYIKTNNQEIKLLFVGRCGKELVSWQRMLAKYG